MLKLNKKHITTMRNTTSPMKLCKRACRAVVFVSVQPYHHSVNRQDVIPASFHPINNWKKFLAATKLSTVIRNINHYLKNGLI